MAPNKLQASPGDDYSTEDIKMKIPNMEFIYRLNCEMAKESSPVGAPFNGTHSRIIMPIVGGTVKGPRINGTIQHMSGADWGTMVKGTGYVRLDARYTLETDDGYFIYVRSKGIFLPNKIDSSTKREPRTMSQSDVDWFTRLQFDAGPGPYNWMNGVFGIGVLSMHEGRIIIDAYRLTNFPGQAVRDVTAKI